MCSFILFVTFLIHTCNCKVFGGGSKIQLYKENATDIFGLLLSQTPASNLLDEQDIAGDPLNNPSSAGKCYTPYFPTDSNDWYSINNPTMPGPSAVIDLGNKYDITNIAIFINYNNDFKMTLLFTTNNPFDENIIYKEIYNVDSSWGKNNWYILNYTTSQISKPVQYITISYYNSPHTAVLETVIYGTLSKLPFPIKLTKNQNKLMAAGTVDMGMLMGTNGFGWTPQHSNLSTIVGTVREYEEWAFTEGGQSTNYPGYPNNQNRFECAAQGGFCLDDDYKYAVTNGLHWHQCLMETPAWVHNYNQSRNQWKPIADNIYFNDNATMTPSSYIMYADHIFQAAARYGRTKVDDALLKLAPNQSQWDSTPQPRISGVNLLNWIEFLNEPNCWWTNRQEWYSGLEQAALQSAAYDGHCGTMPNTVGAKNADKTMKISVGALANDSTVLDRWQTMVWWSEQYRISPNCFQTFPAEAINVHFYAQNDATNYNDIQGISPEEYNVYNNIKRLSDWRDRIIPNVELWVTEYGYDTNSASTQGAPSIGEFSSFEVQGMWIMRTILSMSATGVQRAHQYMWSDVGGQSSQGTYATSGLVDINNNPKVSYYYFSTMYRILNGTNFIKRNCNLSMSVCMQIFESNKQVYVVWCPSSKDQKVSGYKLQTMDTSSNTATLVTPIENDTNGKRTQISGSNGMFTIDVSELPVFVILQS